MMEKSQIPYDTMSTNSETNNSESTFSKCCCCIPLRVGCFILGYISLIVNLIRSSFFVGITVYYGIKTHGYTTAFYDDDQAEETDKERLVEGTTLRIIGWTFVIISIIDLFWLAVNIACLVGIHKKRAGPIRVFVGFATTRLCLTIAGYLLYGWSTFPTDNVTHCLDFAITAYFIFVYYLYARKLEKEAAVEATVNQLPKVFIHDVSIYPPKIEKEHLVL